MLIFSTKKSRSTKTMIAQPGSTELMIIDDHEARVALCQVPTMLYCSILQTMAHALACISSGIYFDSSLRLPLSFASFIPSAIQSPIIVSETNASDQNTGI